MSRRFSESINYRPSESGVLRPYLWLDLIGPETWSEVGIVDSGADNTVLPLGIAERLGYNLVELETIHVQQVSGTTEIRKANRPLRAQISGLPFEFNLEPFFVDNQTVLWGRSDFMKAWYVGIDEVGKKLDLTWQGES